MTFGATGTLVFGALGSQVIAFAALPFITYIYSPDDFNTLAVYISIVTTFSVIACARFDIAIPTPESDVDAANLLSLSIFISSLFSTLLLVVLIILQAVSGSVDESKVASILFIFIPFGVWAGSIYNALQNWSTRNHRYPLVAKTRVGQASLGVIAQVGLGKLGQGVSGLIFGHLIMTSGGAISHAVAINKKDRTTFSKVSWKGMWQILVEYKRYPQYSVIDGLASNASVQLPILLIAILAVGPEAGFLALAMRAISAPFQIMSNAVSQVYLSQAPRRYRDGELKSYTRYTLLGLAAMSMLPIAILALFAVPVFTIVFGPEWARSGEIFLWLAPWIVLKFLASPISWILNIVGKQKLLMKMKLGMLVTRTLSVVSAYFLFNDYLVEAYALSGALVNMANLFVYVAESEKH